MISRAARPMRPARNSAPKATPIKPSDCALANRPSMRLVGPQAEGERDEAGEAGPGEAAEAEAPAGKEAGFLRRLDLALLLVDRRRRGRGRDRIVLRRMIAAGASGAGPSSTATRASSSRKRAGGAGVGSCQAIPDQELQRAVEPDLRRRAAARE